MHNKINTKCIHNRMPHKCVNYLLRRGIFDLLTEDLLLLTVKKKTETQTLVIFVKLIGWLVVQGVQKKLFILVHVCVFLLLVCDRSFANRKATNFRRINEKQSLPSNFWTPCSTHTKRTKNRKHTQKKPHALRKFTQKKKIRNRNWMWKAIPVHPYCSPGILVCETLYNTNRSIKKDTAFTDLVKVY